MILIQLQCGQTCSLQPFGDNLNTHLNENAHWATVGDNLQI